VVNLEQAVPIEREVRSIGQVGRRTPLHCTAAGKVLAAYLPDKELDRLLAQGLARYTPQTITDPDELRMELERVRENGYALALEELEAGLNVVSAPVSDAAGRVVAAVSISGPASRLLPENLRSLIVEVTGVAQELSKELRHHPASYPVE
jgi:DNA-binding IclR family transcriptional regulator